VKAGFAYRHPRGVPVRHGDAAAATIDRPNRRPVRQFKLLRGRAGGVPPAESTRRVEDAPCAARRPGGLVLARHLQHRARRTLHQLLPVGGLGRGGTG
jgi:hypothetical protein